MTFKLCIPIALVAVAFISVEARPSFTNLIPNGNQVSNPCGTDTWDAVGHVTPTGTGLNPFGRDFQAAGRKWTTALCQKDSDGDGRTNGDELGDPNCAWTNGATPDGLALGHPGICEPVDSALCRGRNTFLNANNCPSLAGSTGSSSSSSVPNRPPRGPSPPNTGGNNMPRIPPNMTNEAPKNLWELNRNCVCYCINRTAMIAQFNATMERWNESASRMWNQYRDPQAGNDRSRMAWNIRGSPQGRGRPQLNQQRGPQGPQNWGNNNQQNQMMGGPRNSQQSQGMNGPQQRGMAGMGNNGGLMGMLGGMPPGAAGAIFQRLGDHFGGGGDRQMPGPDQWRDHMPPIDQTPEFNNTDRYDVKQGCTCACPKS